jgi:hypothetical protein
MFRRIFPAGAAGTWAATTPREDGPREWRSPRQPRGHPLGTRCPLVSVVLPQRSLGRGCGPRCFGVARTPFSKETWASSPACLRSSSARRSLVCAPLIEGERTDAVASRWHRDDRSLDLVEVECAMPSSRSTSSRHYFMAPNEAVELGGWRSNSLAADNTVGAALDGVWDACAGVCCCTACTTAALDSGRSGTRGAEDAAFCSIKKSFEVSARCSMIRTIMLSEKTSKSFKPCPYMARQMSERKSPAGWRSAPALNPKMRRGLIVLLVTRLVDEHTRAREGLEWFGPPERNTLLHYVMYCCGSLRV